MVLRKHELEAKLKDDVLLVQSGAIREDNPLDTSSEFEKFLEACRRGDLKTCQELISEGININAKDSFDYTPLIIASLCGHFELVQLLLEAGALAERNTFQGERCIYNALNDKIRNLLLQYDYSKSSDPLLPWSSHISSLLARDGPVTADITITSSFSEPIRLHRFLLASRSPYFQRKLADPETESWKFPPSIPIDALQIVIRYLYLGDIPRDVVSPNSHNTEEEVFKGIDKISKQLEIERLWQAILSINDRRMTRQRHQDEVELARQQMERFFVENVLRHKIVVDSRYANSVKWPVKNSIFADVLLRADEAGGDDLDDVLNELKMEGQDQLQGERTIRDELGIPIGPGAVDVPNDELDKKTSVLFPVHKAMLCRSPFFETMFSHAWMEGQDAEHLRVVKVDCAPEVLEMVLTFLYAERVECPLSLGLDLLYAADMLFLDRLKTKAAVLISTLGSGRRDGLADRTHAGATWNAGGGDEGEEEALNIYDVVHAAWDLKVQRLEEFAARFVAGRLEDYIDDPDFAELIRESAHRLSRREETDTIELLDDIRYYLGERFRMRFEDTGFEDLEEELAEGDDASLRASGDAEVLPRDDGVDGAGNVKTLDGLVVEDDFEADAINHEVLLGKLDAILERLNLDA